MKKMPGRSTTIIATGLIAMVLGGCANESRPEWLDGFQVGPKAENGFFVNSNLSPDNGALADIPRRSDALRKMRGKRWYSYKAGEKVCPKAPDEASFQKALSASLSSWRNTRDGDQNAYQFSRLINASALSNMIDHSTERAERDIAALADHAKNGAWMHPSPRWSSYNTVAKALGPLTPAWRILRQTSGADPKRRILIDGWISSLVRYADLHPKTDQTTSSRIAPMIQAGMMLGDRSIISRSVDIYDDVLDLVDEKGSFPFAEAQARKRSVGGMVAAAFIAEHDGIDLWSKKGKSGAGIHEAIRSISGIDDPLENPEFGWSDQGWMALYTKRFPDSAGSKALADHSTENKKIFGDTAGGWISCYLGEI